MTQLISSTQNPLIKHIVRLQQKASVRRQEKSLIVEGRREASLAIASGLSVGKLFYCPEIYTEDPHYPIHWLKQSNMADRPVDLNLIQVSREVYNKMAYRSNLEGVLIMASMPEIRPERFLPGSSPLIMVLEGIEKPGNLGAIMRTADAAGVSAVVLADARTDVYNPNVIRSSLGCVFNLPVFSFSASEAMAWLKQLSQTLPLPLSIFSAVVQAERSAFEVSMKGPLALVFGAEDTGLSKAWREPPFVPVRIPMAGKIDSLNLSASVAILCFEAVRQRLTAH